MTFGEKGWKERKEWWLGRGKTGGKGTGDQWERKQTSLCWEEEEAGEAENRDMKTKQRAAWAARTLSGGCISANTQTEVQKWTQQESKCQRLTSAREQNCFLIHSFTRHWRFSADLMSIYNEIRGRDPEVRSSGLFSFLFLSPLSSGSAPCLPLHRGGFTGRTKSEMKNCHKKEFKPRGVPPNIETSYCSHS